MLIVNSTIRTVADLTATGSFHAEGKNVSVNDSSTLGRLTARRNVSFTAGVPWQGLSWQQVPSPTTFVDVAARRPLVARAFSAASRRHDRRLYRVCASPPSAFAAQATGLTLVRRRAQDIAEGHNDDGPHHTHARPASMPVAGRLCQVHYDGGETHGPARNSSSAASPPLPRHLLVDDSLVSCFPSLVAC